jgi:hypothetical protein
VKNGRQVVKRTRVSLFAGLCLFVGSPLLAAVGLPAKPASAAGGPTVSCGTTVIQIGEDVTCHVTGFAPNELVQEGSTYPWHVDTAGSYFYVDASGAGSAGYNAYCSFTPGTDTVSFNGLTSGLFVSVTLTVVSPPVQSCLPPPPPPTGYWEAAADGGVFSFGNVGFYGSMGGTPLNGPVVGMEATSDGKGYWLVASDGGVFAFGDAQFFGSTANSSEQDIIGIAATPDGKGYWLVSNNGPAGTGHAAVYAFGDAQYYGTAPFPLNRPIVGIASTPDGKGYWLVASDGGVFGFGDAPFEGSMVGLGQHVSNTIGIASTSGGAGYWVATATGAVAGFGSAANFPGSPLVLNAPVSSIVPTSAGNSYWLFAGDGGVFAFGGAPYEGSLPGLGVHVTDIAGSAAVPVGRTVP